VLGLCNMTANAPPTYVVLIKSKDGTNTYEFRGVSDIAWEWYENDVGRCVFKIPANDRILNSTAIPANTFQEILIFRNGTLIWQGFVAYVFDVVDSCTIYGLTFTEFLKWYRDGYKTVYTSKKIGSEFISPIYDIIAAVDNSVFARITKGTIQDPYVTSTSTAKTVTKTVYDEPFFELLQDMVAISRADSPVGAWKQDSVFEITFSETAPTFNFWRDVGTDRSDVVFQLDSEIVDFSYGTDFRFVQNDVKGFAVVTGPSVITSSQVDTTSVTSYYRRQLSPYYGSLTGQSQLDEKSKDFLQTYKDPTRHFSITLAAGMTPFSGYNMGDGVKVRISRGRINLDEFFRVVGMEVQLDNKGVEIVKPVLERKRTD